MTAAQSASSVNSGNAGTSHIGATDSSGWYQAKDRPLTSHTG